MLDSVSLLRFVSLGILKRITVLEERASDKFFSKAAKDYRERGISNTKSVPSVDEENPS
jgi:hypothetical protein